MDNKALAQQFGGKFVIVLTRDGHWYFGRLKAVDRGGVVLTAVRRLLPKMTPEGEPVRNDELMITERKSFPFVTRFEEDGRIREVHTRKMWIPYGHISLILRAKDKEEIEKEEAERAEKDS